MKSIKTTARMAGLLYFLLIISGVYGLIYIPSKIIVKGDVVATANKIISNEFLFRTSIINDLIGHIAWIFLCLILYRLFKAVNEKQAKILVVLVFVQIPVVFIMDAFNITSLMILKGEVMQTFQLNQRQDLALLFIKITDYAKMVLELFWGLWLFPLAILVYQSNFIPRFVGIWLFINGIYYVIVSLIILLLPQYKEIISNPLGFPAMLGELVFTMWLLIIGVRQLSTTLALNIER